MIVEIGEHYGLGNQMYVYAFAKALQHYCNKEVCLYAPYHDAHYLETSLDSIRNATERERERDLRAHDLSSFYALISA